VLAPAANAAIPTPDEDPFYVPPAGLAQAKPGEILNSRPIDVTAFGLPLPVDGHQLLYRTKDTHGAPEAAVATVILPRGEPPAGGRPLLSYQPAEDTLTRNCASSYEIRTGQQPELPEALGPLMTEGAAVVIPDYEGPESHWIAGVQAGRAVLDSIRATEAFAPAGLDGAATPVAVWGYSGGGHATAWAAELQPRYAPELNLVASAHGAAPYVLRKTVAYLDGTPYAGIMLAAVVGIGRAYPEMRLDEALNDAGKAMRDKIGTQCIEQFAFAYPGARLDDFTRVPNTQDLPHVSRVIDADDLGHRTPKAPTYLYQSATDELEPVAGADAIVDNYCRRGVTVQYERAPIGEHIAYQILGAPAAAAYIADRLAGKPAPNTCPPGAEVAPERCALVVRLRHRRGERIRRVVARVSGRRVVRRGRNLRRLRIAGFSPGPHTIRLKLRTTRGTRTLVVRRRVSC
jgi:acetyl esterase/lipase